MRTNKIYSGLLEISTSYRGVLLDAYGVFWGGNAFGEISGAKNVMEKLVKAGKCVGILSNATQLADKEIKKLDDHGFILDTHFHFLITSGEVSRQVFIQGQLPFSTPRNTFWLFGGAHPHYPSHQALFERSKFRQVDSIHDADFIYLPVPHKNGLDQTDPDLFKEDLEKIITLKLPMVCSNPDRFAHEGNPPRLVVRQGSIAWLYETMGGEVFYIGKPHKHVYEVALRKFSEKGIGTPHDILMVGDTPETDIRGANSIGMPSALVMTGIMGERIRQNENAIQELEDQPDFIIERVGHAVRSSQ